MTSPAHPATSFRKSLQPAFAAFFGAFLGLSLLKFGNPPIMEKWVSRPTNALEFFLDFPWPITWAYTILGLVVLLGLFCLRRPQSVPRWLVALPLVWLIWQFVASTESVDPGLTNPTLAHFTACCACFYLGLLCMGRTMHFPAFWVGLIVAFLLVLATGFQQHFGGLEQTRRYFEVYIYPTLKDPPPEYLKKMSSNRIFSTLFYPNALAGAILLVLPPVLSCLAQLRRQFTPAARAFLISTVSLAAVACLYWSGSKGGWLLLLLLGLLALLQLRFDKRAKILLVSGVLFLGLLGFLVKYAGFFQKGATSVVARFDYWQAALKTTAAHPLFGTGPGTFAKPYHELKRPEAEMSRLVHNDYLEQASDSGFPGFLAYTTFIVAALVYSYPGRSIRMPAPGSVGSGCKPASSARRQTPSSTAVALASPPVETMVVKTVDWRALPIWLGVLGWALQGFLEFGLYLPALAWPAFGFLGLLLGPIASTRNRVDKAGEPDYSPAPA